MLRTFKQRLARKIVRKIRRGSVKTKKIKPTIRKKEPKEIIQNQLEKMSGVLQNMQNELEKNSNLTLNQISTFQKNCDHYQTITDQYVKIVTDQKLTLSIEADYKCENYPEGGLNLRKQNVINTIINLQADIAEIHKHFPKKNTDIPYPPDFENGQRLVEVSKRLLQSKKHTKRVSPELYIACRKLKLSLVLFLNECNRVPRTQEQQHSLQEFLGYMNLLAHYYYRENDLPLDLRIKNLERQIDLMDNMNFLIANKPNSLNGTAIKCIAEIIDKLTVNKTWPEFFKDALKKCIFCILTGLIGDKSFSEYLQKNFILRAKSLSEIHMLKEKKPNKQNSV